MSRTVFTAWRPDAAGRGQLAALADRLREAAAGSAPRLKPRRPDQWHATLCFIGRNQPHLATPALREALAEVARSLPPHAFTVERLVYWAGSGAVVALPRECPALQALCDATGDAVRRSCGIEPEETVTQPHVTLAYLDRRLPPQAWLDAVDCGGPPLRVERFELLHNPGGRYAALGEWALAGTTLPRKPEQAQLF